MKRQYCKVRSKSVKFIKERAKHSNQILAAFKFCNLLALNFKCLFFDYVYFINMLNFHRIWQRKKRLVRALCEVQRIQVSWRLHLHNKTLSEPGEWNKNKHTNFVYAIGALQISYLLTYKYSRSRLGAIKRPS